MTRQQSFSEFMDWIIDNTAFVVNAKQAGSIEGIKVFRYQSGQVGIRPYSVVNRETEPILMFDGKVTAKDFTCLAEAVEEYNKATPEKIQERGTQTSTPRTPSTIEAILENMKQQYYPC